MDNENRLKKKKIIIIVAAVLAMVAAVVCVLFFKSRIRATTMRILRMEGEISLEDDGKSKSVKESLRLKSGNVLSTAIESLVSIGLDDTKIVTLDELSRAEFDQAGRKLDLKLTDGSLFFEVQKPLADDETMDIRTSTMVVGIRGTSGWVSVEGDHESLIITDGHVHIIGINPKTGEKKETDVYAGQRVSTYLYDNRDVDSIMFFVENVTERDLPEFLLERLRENPTLLDKVCKETGWDRPWILGTKNDIPTVAPTPPDDNTPDTGVDTEAETDEETEGSQQEESLPKVDPEVEGLSRSEIDSARGMIAFTNTETGVVVLSDGTLFDPVWYAESNPDVVAKYGTTTEALVAHYLKQGKKEGRPPLRPVTPTPTPTQTWEETKTESHDDDDDDDDDDNSGTSTPSQTSTPAQSTTGSVSQTAGNSPDVTINLAGGGTAPGTIDNTGKLFIYGPASVTLPVTLTGSYTDVNGQTVTNPTFSNFGDFFERCGDALQGGPNAGTFSVTDPATNKTIKYYAAGGSPLQDPYTIVDSNGNENYCYSSYQDAVNDIPNIP